MEISSTRKTDVYANSRASVVRIWSMVILILRRRAWHKILLQIRQVLQCIPEAAPLLRN